jgi:hypothetical protein
VNSAAREQQAAGPRLHRPWRALVAAVDIALACVAVWMAFRLWPMGIVEVANPLDDGAGVTSTVYSGEWIAASIGLATLAGLLLLDALRQLVLEVRTRGADRTAAAGPVAQYGGTEYATPPV